MEPGQTEPTVETVLGPVAADQLGVVLPHEHLPLLLGSVADQPYGEEPLGPPAAYVPRLDLLARQALQEARALGLGSLVEVTPIGQRRCLPLMQELSRATGVHVIASTGLYLDGRQPPWAMAASLEELRDRFIGELTEGVRDTGVRPWMIKIAGANPLTDQERKVFQAAAAASRATGAAITTHSFQAVGEHFRALVAAGADPARIYLGHADFSQPTGDHLLAAREGAHLIFTCWGIEHFVRPGVLVDLVRDLVEADRAGAVLVSIDYALGYAGNRIDLISTDYEVADRTYGFLFRYVLPRLRGAGFTDDQIRQFTVENPRQMLLRPSAPPAPAPARPITVNPL